MNSQERREARYQRRKTKREERRLAMVERYNFERVANPDRLYKAMKEARRGVYWKASVQRYNMNYLRNILRATKDLQAGNDVRKGFIEFDIVERGKPRHIRSVHFAERVVQRSLCANALKPQLTRSLIYDNGASLEDKGIHFAINRLKAHLSRLYKEHGCEGYILLVDFKGYYDNIQHEPIRDIYAGAFGEDEKLLGLSMLFIQAFGDHGLGLGSEVCQIAAISYSSANDHYAKEVLRCSYYGRYMDDSYFICESKEQAQQFLNAMRAKYAELGITASPRKTAIVKLTHGFKFLKTHFSLEPDSGQVVLRPSREAITRQRRKLKKLKNIYEAGKMTMAEVRGAHMSWRGYIMHTSAGKTVQNMDALYERLFGISPLVKLPKI